MSYEPRSYDPYAMEKKLNSCVGGGGFDPSVLEEIQEEISVLGSENATMAQDITDIKGSLNSIRGSLNSMSNMTTDEVEVGTYLGQPRYRKTINFGALPSATTKSVDLGVTIANLVKLYGVASDGTTFLPIPTPATSANYAIEFSCSATQLTATTAQDRSDFSAYVTIEYTKVTP